MGLVSLFESWQKHRHTLKDVANITSRLNKLERQSRSSTKQIAGKVKDTHVVTDETGQAKLRIYFESGAVYEIAYGSEEH